jgi:hypothetical protein
LTVAAGFLAAIMSSGAVAVATTNGRTIHVEDGVDYRAPDSSPMRFVELGRYGAGRFQGRLEVAGIWHYGYQTDDPDDDSDYGVPVLYFVPDPAGAEKLPYWLQRGRVRSLRFTNEVMATNALVPLSTRSAFAAGHIRSASGRAVVRVAGYRISIECDNPTYWTTFVAVERPGSFATSESYVKRPWC